MASCRQTQWGHGREPSEFQTLACGEQRYQPDSGLVGYRNALHHELVLLSTFGQGCLEDVILLPSAGILSSRIDKAGR